MSEIPTFEIARLREIGWTLWDPIGLAPIRDDCDDEYDRYLLQMAAMLWESASGVAAVDYLVQIEAEHMALGKCQSVMQRSQATANAIAAYLAELRA